MPSWVATVFVSGNRFRGTKIHIFFCYSISLTSASSVGKRWSEAHECEMTLWPICFSTSSRAALAALPPLCATCLFSCIVCGLRLREISVVAASAKVFNPNRSLGFMPDLYLFRADWPHRCRRRSLGDRSGAKVFPSRRPKWSKVTTRQRCGQDAERKANMA